MHREGCAPHSRWFRNRNRPNPVLASAGGHSLLTPSSRRQIPSIGIREPAVEDGGRGNSNAGMILPRLRGGRSPSRCLADSTNARATLLRGGRWLQPEKSSARGRRREGAPRRLVSASRNPRTGTGKARDEVGQRYRGFQHERRQHREDQHALDGAIQMRRRSGERSAD